MGKRIRCDWLHCSKTAEWVVYGQWSPVCLCKTHIGDKFTSPLAKREPIPKSNNPTSQ